MGAATWPLQQKKGPNHAVAVFKRKNPRNSRGERQRWAITGSEWRVEHPRKKGERCKEKQSTRGEEAAEGETRREVSWGSRPNKKISRTNWRGRLEKNKDKRERYKRELEKKTF